MIANQLGPCPTISNPTTASSHPNSILLPGQSWARSISQLIQAAIYRLMGMGYSWQTRQICHRTLQLLEQKCWSDQELTQLRNGLDAIIEQSRSSRFWLMKLQIPEGQLIPRYQLLKLLRCVEFTSQLTPSESQRLSLSLRGLDSDLPPCDLALRAFTLCAAKFQEVRQSIQSVPPLLSKRWQQVEQLLNPLSEKANQLLQKAKTPTLSSSRNIVFYSRKGQEALQPGRTWHAVDYIFELFRIRHSHIALMTSHNGQTGIAHMGGINHEIKPCSDADLLTADILELSAEKMLDASSKAQIAKLMGLSEEQSIEAINLRLSQAIEKQHQIASQLSLKNRVNVIFVAYYKMLNFLFPTSGRMAHGSNFQPHQTVNCSQYAVSVIFNSILSVNQDLIKEFKLPSMPLYQPFNTDVHPGGITPKEVLRAVSKVCKPVQTNAPSIESM